MRIRVWKIAMPSPIQIAKHDSIAYASGDIFTLGSESRHLQDAGWHGEQHTGPRHAIAFSLLPIAVDFADEDPVLLGPTTLAMTKPQGAYRRTPRSERGQRTLFLSMPTDLACELVGAFSAEDAERREDPFPSRYGPCDPSAQAAAWQLDRLVFSKRSQIDPMAFDEVAMHIVHQALRGIYADRRQRRTPDLPVGTRRAQRKSVDEAIALMCAQPGRAWVLSELADSVELSPGYLSRLFRTHTGHTMSHTLTIVRLMHAIERIADMRGQLTRLAIECGFASHAHMSYCFNAHLGIAPTQLVASGSREISETLNHLASRLRLS